MEHLYRLRLKQPNDDARFFIVMYASILVHFALLPVVSRSNLWLHIAGGLEKFLH